MSSQKDSQWLQLEVCREFQKSNCVKSDCKFAHPLPHVETTVDGKVMACYDSFKSRCRRVSPPCKFYHPTTVLMETLMARGRNYLAMKSATSEDAAGTSRKPEIGVKRAAEVSEIPIELMYFKRPTLAPPSLAFPVMNFLPQTPVFLPPPPAVSIVPSDPTAVIPLNAPYVNYVDSNGQILDNLPVCQDFNRNMCTRINCKFVHLLEPKKLEIHEQRVAVCRDHVNGICRRQQCKYYHIPIHLPAAHEMAMGGKSN